MFKLSSAHDTLGLDLCQSDEGKTYLSVFEFASLSISKTEDLTKYLKIFFIFLFSANSTFISFI